MYKYPLDSRIYFYVRGGWDSGGRQVNVPVVMNADGTKLRPLKDFIGGHPEWLDGQRLIGTMNNEQIIYDCEAMQVVGRLGDKKLFPKPGDDIARQRGGGAQGRHQFVRAQRIPAFGQRAGLQFPHDLLPYLLSVEGAP